jgi:hypothetical protein
MTVPLDAADLADVARAFTALAVRDYQAHGPFPQLRHALDTGQLVYREDPPGRDEWLLPSEAFAAPVVDCEDLAGIRVGELVTSGEDLGATVDIVQEDTPGKWHAIVRRSDGTYEDPTRYALARAAHKERPDMRPTFRCHKASDGTDLATVTVPWADGNAYAVTAAGDDPAHALDAATDTATEQASMMQAAGLVDPEAVLALDAIRTVARMARDGTLSSYAHQLGGGAKTIAHHLLKSLGIGGVGAGEIRSHRGGMNYTVPHGEEGYTWSQTGRVDRFGNPIGRQLTAPLSAAQRSHAQRAPAPARGASTWSSAGSPQVPEGFIVDPQTGQLVPDPAYWSSYGYDSWGGGYQDPWGGANPYAQSYGMSGFPPGYFGAGAGGYPPGYFGGGGNPYANPEATAWQNPYGLPAGYFGQYSPAWGAELAMGADPYSALMGDQGALEGLFAAYGVQGVRGVDGELMRMASGPVAGVDQGALEGMFAAQRGR